MQLISIGKKVDIFPICNKSVCGLDWRVPVQAFNIAHKFTIGMKRDLSQLEV